MPDLGATRGVAIFFALSLLVAIQPRAALARDVAVSDLKLVEFSPWLTVRKGPEKAKGVIYFIRGWGGVTTGGASLDEFQLVPYFIKTLADKAA
jgi:hypothetical protein